MFISTYIYSITLYGGGEGEGKGYGKAEARKSVPGREESSNLAREYLEEITNSS